MYFRFLLIARVPFDLDGEVKRAIVDCRPVFAAPVKLHLFMRSRCGDPVNVGLGWGQSLTLCVSSAYSSLNNRKCKADSQFHVAVYGSLRFDHHTIVYHNNVS